MIVALNRMIQAFKQIHSPFWVLKNTWSTSSTGQQINSLNEPYISETIPPVTTEQTLLTLDILDMASILKSSQVISSEVKFDSLLKSVMGHYFGEFGALIVVPLLSRKKSMACVLMVVNKMVV